MCIYYNSYEVTCMHESNAQSHFFSIVLVPNYAWYETVYYFFLLLYNDEIIFHECTLIYLRDLRLLVLDEKSKL